MHGHGNMTLPGWYGKLPGFGDFASRRLPQAVMQRWDAWLQSELLKLRSRFPDWTQRYLSAPVWGFLLGPGVLDEHSWIGTMMPSVDAVGRYFPLTILQELDASGQCAEVESEDSWWSRTSALGLLALDQDLDAEAFDARLARDLAQATACPGEERVPPNGLSQWHDLSGGEPMACGGLPAGTLFAHLFDLSEAGSTTARRDHS